MHVLGRPIEEYILQPSEDGEYLCITWIVPPTGELPASDGYHFMSIIPAHELPRLMQKLQGCCRDLAHRRRAPEEWGGAPVNEA